MGTDKHANKHANTQTETSIPRLRPAGGPGRVKSYFKVGSTIKLYGQDSNAHEANFGIYVGNQKHPK